MFRELMSIFRSDDPLESMGQRFSKMVSLADEMTLAAGKMFFAQGGTPEERTELYDQDVKVNKLERSIRKRVVAHLSLTATRSDLAYCLYLMGLVKDVERIGDYAKNLSEVRDIYGGPLPDDPMVEELQELRGGVEAMFASALEIIDSDDREQAINSINSGRNLATRADALIGRIAQSHYDAGVVTALVLATRYYKRIGGHVMNVLSSVVMPVHKVDFFDEDEIDHPRETPSS